MPLSENTFSPTSSAQCLIRQRSPSWLSPESFPLPLDPRETSVFFLFHVFPSPCPSPAPFLASSFFGSLIHSYLFKLAYTKFLCYPKFLFCFVFKSNVVSHITLWDVLCFNEWPSQGTEYLLRFCGRSEGAPSIKVWFREVREKSLYRSFNYWYRFQKSVV